MASKKGRKKSARRPIKKLKSAAKKLARAVKKAVRKPSRKAKVKAGAKKRAAKAARKTPKRAAKKTAKRTTRRPVKRTAKKATARARRPARAAQKKQPAIRGLVLEAPSEIRAASGMNGDLHLSAPPPPPPDAVEISGIYERVMYSENDPYQEVREVFGHYDRDKSGSIDAPEFRRVCEALGVEMDEDELAVGLSVVDSDGDGRISWDEFLGWWQSR